MSSRVRRPAPALRVRACVCALLVAVACSPGSAPEERGVGGPVAAPNISVREVREDLAGLEEIADEAGGNRAHGEPGYRASVEFLREQLDAAGFRTRVQRFAAVGGAGYNLLADWPGGDTGETLVAGAHLDSVDEGAGINDNASGSAALLRIALAVAEERLRPARHLRFAWWGAEEPGLYGSRHYVRSLGPDGRERVSGYLNFDMVGSPNPGYFVYGDGRSLREPLVTYLEERGVPVESTTAADGLSDQAPFQDAGIPVAGLFTGASAPKSAAQARKWGGEAGEPFDPCYHAACDDGGNVDAVALDRSADAMAYAVWKLAR